MLIYTDSFVFKDDRTFTKHWILDGLKTTTTFTYLARRLMKMPSGKQRGMKLETEHLCGYIYISHGRLSRTKIGVSKSFQPTKRYASGIHDLIAGRPDLCADRTIQCCQ